MKLKDLNNIDINDLKNIDWRRAKEQLQSRPDLIINVLLVVATLAIVFVTYNKYASTKKASKQEIAELRKKVAALKKSETAQKQNNDFLKDIPKAIAGDQLIAALSEFAIRRDVQILSFSLSMP